MPLCLTNTVRRMPAQHLKLLPRSAALLEVLAFCGNVEYRWVQHVFGNANLTAASYFRNPRTAFVFTSVVLEPHANCPGRFRLSGAGRFSLTCPTLGQGLAWQGVNLEKVPATSSGLLTPTTGSRKLHHSRFKSCNVSRPRRSRKPPGKSKR
jgi:hypothetical protein